MGSYATSGVSSSTDTARGRWAAPCFTTSVPPRTFQPPRLPSACRSTRRAAGSPIVSDVVALQRPFIACVEGDQARDERLDHFEATNVSIEVVMDGERSLPSLSRRRVALLRIAMASWSTSTSSTEASKNGII
jgi:hypothetical protein